MRNKLFASAHGVMNVSWCIAVLLSFSTMIGVTNMLVAQEKDTMQDTRSKIQDNQTSGIVDRASQCDPKSEIQNLSSASIGDPQLDKAVFAQKTKKLQIPFIANDGQTDERVRFYANTFGGTVFVTKEGEIVYSLPKAEKSEDRSKNTDVRTQNPEDRSKIQDNRESCILDLASDTNGASGIVHPASYIVDRDSKTEFQNPKSEITAIALREEFVGAKVKAIQGEDPSIAKVNYFKGNDPEKWKTDISTYDMVNLGEIYKGIELRLKAYGDNVEKLFCVKPGADTERIRLRLSGGKDFNINNKGELEVETELGLVKFTKPMAYQEINGRRVEVSVEYRVESSEAENKSSKHKTCNAKLMSTNPKSAIQNLSSTEIGEPKLEYGFKVASYDRTKDLIIDPLLASTYLGGSSSDSGGSLTLDTSGNVYVMVYTFSSDFPTTSGGYDTSYNGGAGDVFVSKLDSNLSASSKPTVTTSSTTNVTSSSATLNGTANANGLSTSAWFNYGITSGSYSGTSTTQSVSGSSDTTVSIGISGLSSSTTYYYRIAASSSAGTSYGSEASFTTSSAPTPTPTPTPSDTTAPSGSVSINSGDLYTNSTAVTLTLTATDSVGVVGYYASTSLSTPTASASGWNSVTSATSYTGSVSYTLASGDETKTVYVWYKDSAGNVSSVASDSITLDTTAPIVTITSPTSSDTYTATSNTVSLSGSASDTTSGVKEVTWSSDKGGSGTASGTTYWSVSSINLSNGDNSITVTATDGAGNTSTDILTITYNPITAVTPTPTTSPAPTLPPLPTPAPTLPPLPTPQVSPSPIVFGFVNDQDEQSLKGVTITITGKNSSDTTETDENGYYEFSGLAKGDYTLTYEKEGFLAQTQDISLKEGEVKDLVTVTMEQVVKGKISGYVLNIKGDPIESVRLKLKGIKTKVIKTASSDADGFFEFTDLEADTYVIIAKKKKYRNTQQKVKLEEGASEEIEIVMKKTSKRIKELLLEEEVQ